MIQDWNEQRSVSDVAQPKVAYELSYTWTNKAVSPMASRSATA
jgi:hypothetical protein